MASATDQALRAKARALAARILVDLAKSGVATHRGIGRIDTRRAVAADGDVDLDRSLDAVVGARAAGQAISLDDLHVRSWVRPDTALCLLVDRSGSMTGERLATSALAAAAVTYRHGHDCSVVAFGSNAIVVKSQDQSRHADGVADDLLQLRGHGVTDLGLAVRTAASQLGRSRAGRRVTLLLSDARSTSGDDPTADAAALAALGELVILCPAGDRADAEALAEAAGARLVPVDGPGDVPRAIAEALG
ncbi:MAG: VWA domain-containing protein [Actinobacteria bacterium]|nr:VWA domain-containing protein [Actinomycetota bacterium]